ncbi:T9SS type B sorting domain-containing protein [Gaetbulibacter sp. M240]|uniref:T9SS type B sorting domain-containing protein n=1 Tax=Gaetbulibacter sp. M240 TaxID=3126511 RepID=UPI00374E324C
MKQFKINLKENWMIKSQIYHSNLVRTCFLISLPLFGNYSFSQTSALYFDGVNDYAMADINLPSDYTFEFYMKFHDLTVEWETIFNFNEGGWTPWFGTDYGIGKKLEFWDGNYLFQTNSVLSEEVWYHIALVKHEAKIYVYLEGERIFIYNGQTTVLNGPFSIGGQETLFNGNITIDELRISSNARYIGDFYDASGCEFSIDSDTYALYHFNDGSPSQFAKDDSGNGHDLRLGTSVGIDASDPKWISDGIGVDEIKIIGDTTLCQSISEISYTVNLKGIVFEYFWQINGDLEISSGQGTSTITVKPIPNGNTGTAEICLIVDAGCGLTLQDCQLIQIKPIEEITLTYLPEQTICGLDNPIYLAVSQDNQTGEWSGPGIQNNRFYPEIAGLGIHELIFSLENDECKIGVFSIEVLDCDCAGTPNGNALMDDCGKCLEPSDPNFNSCFDCAEVPNGFSVFDSCGECLEPSHPNFNSCLDIIGYPKFFTPNNDGYNDFWQINGIVNFPNSMTLIFDRFGKLLVALSAYDIGWNGLYNGKQMMSNDYWFITDLGDGRSFSGHFSLIR